MTMTSSGVAVNASDNEDDAYQQRYVRHQARKAETLKVILAERHSDRMYSDDPVDDDSVQELSRALVFAPSSCDRQAVSPTLVTERDRKALLGGLLVGGVGWVHRAPVVILLFADRGAYKAPGEIDFMPYLDAGIATGQMWLHATALGLACAYINPNIRPINQGHFRQVFGDGLFCGALAVGWPHPDSPDRKHAETERAKMRGVLDLPDLKVARGGVGDQQAVADGWVAPTDYAGLDTLNVDGPDIVKEDT